MPDDDLSTPIRLVLVRHGESEVTVRRVVGGPRTCTGLSELGRRQADRLAVRLAETRELQVDALYSSGYPRARATADLLSPTLGVEVTVETGFGEHDPGPECDGLTFDEFIDRYGLPDWESDPHAVTFPGGETLAAFHHRVGATLHDVLARHANPPGEPTPPAAGTSGLAADPPVPTVMVVCHGGVIDAVLRLALRAAPSGVFEFHTVNTSLTELIRVRRGRWRLVRYNDAAHLAGLEP